MSTLENTNWKVQDEILLEDAFEVFEEKAEQDESFLKMLKESYFSQTDLDYLFWRGSLNTVLEITFNDLLDKDYEGMVKDPIETAYYYAKNYQPKHMRG